MKYDLQLNLPEGWQKNVEIQKDEAGVEVVHLEAFLPEKDRNADLSSMDIYVGPMPDGETAEDQAFSNYADVVGFDDDDPEDFNPIVKSKFDGRNAYGFEALCEDESPMRFIATELRKGLLAVICVASRDDASLDEVCTMIERNLRVRRQFCE